MAKILMSGVDYAQFFDDLRAVIRHEIKQGQQHRKDEQSPSANSESCADVKGKRQVGKEVANG